MHNVAIFKFWVSSLFHYNLFFRSMFCCKGSFLNISFLITVVFTNISSCPPFLDLWKDYTSPTPEVGHSEVTCFDRWNVSWKHLGKQHAILHAFPLSTGTEETHPEMQVPPEQSSIEHIATRGQLLWTATPEGCLPLE